MNNSIINTTQQNKTYNGDGNGSHNDPVTTLDSLQREQHLIHQADELKKILNLKNQLIRRLEDEKQEDSLLIQDKEWFINNLEKHNLKLQNEVANQYKYIQYVNKINSQLNRVLATLSSELRAFQFSRTTGVLKAFRERNLKKIFSSILPSPIEGCIDSPQVCEFTYGTLTISGWAASNGGNISRVEAFLDDVKLQDLYYGTSRPDVVTNLLSKDNINCGFGSTLNLENDLLESGIKTLKIKITDIKGNHKEFTRLIIFEKNLEISVLENSFAGINTLHLSEKSNEFHQKLYLTWIAKNEPNLAELIAQRKNSASWKYRPFISIILPVFNPPPELLREAIDSVIGQNYENWDLCIVDGASTDCEIKTILAQYAKCNPRIHVKFLDENLGIAGNSNRAIAMAKGEFIALMDHDDVLAPNALYENAMLLNLHPEADMIYSDEDKLDPNGERCEPHFKPDWSPDFFNSTMYTCHLGVYRRSLVNKVGGFHSGFDGAQDYDLVFRLIEQTNHIFHIPKILYHWRKTNGSTALNLNNKKYAKDAQIRAVSGHFERTKVDAEVTPGLADNLLRVKRKLTVNPMVSIIVPTRDASELLRTCLDSIWKHTNYSNYEIIVVDNYSSEVKTAKFFEEISKKPNVRILEYRHPFNFSAINNFAADQAEGDILLFLNNDTEVISDEWLESMIEHAIRPEIGVVGARLLYSNDKVQHAGVIIGIGGVAGHSHKHFPSDHPGYFSRAKAIQNVSAVTAACMMVRKDTFISAGRFNEKNLAVAFNDVDFCLRIRQKNLLIIYTPYAELYHYESLSRGSDHTFDKARRFQTEVEYMLENWNGVLENDPYYNPNLTLEREDFSLNVIK